ncbi:MAG: hypothetical protein ACM37W_10615 [Actinomycetota bacterium]
MPLELIILLAAILVSWLIFNWAIKVLKASISTAITIAVIVLVLQLMFGIGPNELFQHIIHLPQTLWQLVTSR